MAAGTPGSGRGRRGGGLRFARRAAAKERLSKRIDWLNKNAGLAEEIRYGEVKDLLSQLGDRDAMRLLKELEGRSGEEPDPTVFLTMEAERLLEERGEQTPEGNAEHDGGAEGGRKRRRQPWAPRQFSDSAAQASDPEDLQQRVERRVQWLNANAGLSKELLMEEIQDALFSLNRAEAMQVLKDLEENAADVRDPNGYVISNARKAAKGTGMDGRRSGRVRTRQTGGSRNQQNSQRPSRRGAKRERMKRNSERGVGKLREKVQKRVEWLNTNCSLSSELDFEKVGDLLLRIGLQEAMRILKAFEECAGEVRDPNAYVGRAARRVADEAQAQPQPTPRPPPPPSRGMPRGVPQPPPPSTYEQAHNGLEAKLRKRIAWLNEHAALAVPLEFERVADDLMAVDLLTALEVLNNLEENCHTVRDPNGYVAVGVRRKASESAGGSIGSIGGAGQHVVPWRDHPSAGWDRDRRRGGSRGGETDAPRPSNSRMWSEQDSHKVLEQKLKTRIAWLNKNVCSGMLDFGEVGRALMDLPLPQAMDVLRRFEESAPEIRSPNGFVINNARRALSGDGIGSGPSTPRGRSSGAGGGSRPSSAGTRTRAPIGGPPRDMPPPHTYGKNRGGRSKPPTMALPGTAAVDDKVTYYGGGREEKVAQRIDWLNDFADLSNPLVYDKVISDLLKVNHKQAMEVLKRLEDEAAQIRDPNGFVISLVRRRASGDAGDRSRSRRQGSRPGMDRGSIKEELPEQEHAS